MLFIDQYNFTAFTLFKCNGKAVFVKPFPIVLEKMMNLMFLVF